MTKLWSAILAASLVTACGGAAVAPANIPPAPPKWKTEVRAPVLESEEEVAPPNQGFGDSAFDTAPITTTIPTTETSQEEEKEDAEKSEEKKVVAPAEQAPAVSEEAPVSAPATPE